MYVVLEMLKFLRLANSEYLYDKKHTQDDGQEVTQRRWLIQSRWRQGDEGNNISHKTSFELMNIKTFIL